MKLKIKKLHPDAIIPTRSNPTDSGLDLYSVEKYLLQPEEIKIISAGIAIELPKPSFYVGDFSPITIIWEAQIRPRSGLAAKYGLTIINSPGTVDNDYRGEIKVILRNEGTLPILIKKGERIAQMVITPVVIPEVEEVAELSDTERGEGGFGSTGRR